ncbi:hypothetical protein [Rhizobium sp. C4]|uniref:hypothetical protein n=1 Tax=Rhizobium sp. C4 TaxID=1349800 RepID=UPI001E4E39C9|nr:hypothetical protein [Rhizobium sp. C4]MCD2175028.1 hypothetical protein [Rhizobium sp. C4]
MCNLYNITTTRDAVMAFTKAFTDKAGWMRASQFLDIDFSKSRTSVSLKSGQFAEVGPWQPGYHQG